MNAKLSTVLLCCLCVATLAAADRPDAASELGKLISDPKVLRGALGAKAVVVSDPKTGEVSPELLADLKAAHLDEGIQLIALPKEAVQPKSVSRVAPAYPSDLRQRRIDGQVRFVFVIGADGTVKALYCVSASHPDLAISAAAALVQWRYKPAKIQNTAVPVIVSQVLEFNAY